MDTADHILHPVPARACCCRDWPECSCEETTARKATNMLLAALIGVGLMLMLAACIMLAGAGRAHAHDALPTAAKPQGWSYPTSCCSNYDCRQVPASAITEGPNGYVINRTGEVIPMTDKKVRMSPDGEFHWCSQQGRDDGKTICLFTPGRGS